MVKESGLALGEGAAETGGDPPEAAADDVDGVEEEEHADSKQPTAARTTKERSPRIHPPKKRRAVQE